MSRRESRLTLDRRTLLGGALIGGAGAALGARPAAAAPVAARPAGRALPQTDLAPPILTTSALWLKMLLTPVRVYDSRVGQVPEGTDPLTGASDTRLGRSETRKIDVSYVLGDETKWTGVDTATSEAVLLNITAVNTIGASGYLKAWAFGGTEPAISVLNWDHQSAVIANSVTVRHGGGYLMIGCGGAIGCSTNVIIDVIGTYEPPIT